MHSYNDMFRKRFYLMNDEGTLYGNMFQFEYQNDAVRDRLTDQTLQGNETSPVQITTFIIRLSPYLSNLPLINSCESVLQIFNMNTDILELYIDKFDEGEIFNVTRGETVAQILNRFINPQTLHFEFFLTCSSNILNDWDLSMRGG